MSSKSLTILFVLLICTASASAEITLRNNFFTGRVAHSLLWDLPQTCHFL
jgi:hypothetical protein